MRAAWPNVLDEGDFEDWSVCTSRSYGQSPGMVWPDCPIGVTVVYAFVFRDMRYKTADYVVAAANVSPSIEAITGPHRHPASGELVVTANDDILMVWRRDANIRGEVEGLVDELLAEASRRNTRVVETEPRLPVVP